MTLEGFISCIIAAVVLCRLYLWLRAKAVSPDPWGPEVEAVVQSAEAMPVCPHCQAPQEHEGWFCPECGSMVGQYGNYLPSVYIFSMGEACRRLFSRQFRPRPLLVIGYFLALLGFVPLLLPVAFYFVLTRKLTAPEDPALANP